MTQTEPTITARSRGIDLPPVAGTLFALALSVLITGLTLRAWRRARR
jgi:hypothetical protein